MNRQLCWTPATEIAALVREREISPTEVAEASIERIEEVNPKLNATIDFDPERVRASARRLTAEMTTGNELGPLHGVAFTLKDTVTQGTVETGGLAAMKGTVSTSTEPVAERLLGAGGLFLGKTNMAKLGTVPDRQPCYGNTWKPWYRCKTRAGPAPALAPGPRPEWLLWRSGATEPVRF